MLDERLKSSVRRMNRMESGLAAKFGQQVQRIVDELRAEGGGKVDRADGQDADDLQAECDALRSRLDEEMAGRERAERELDRRHAELAAAARELVAAEEKAAQLAATSDQQLRERKAAEEKLRKLKSERNAERGRLEELQAGRGARRQAGLASKGAEGPRESLVRERDRSAIMQTELSNLTAIWSWKAAAPQRAVARRLRNVPRR